MTMVDIKLLTLFPCGRGCGRFRKVLGECVVVIASCHAMRCDRFDWIELRDKEIRCTGRKSRYSVGRMVLLLGISKKTKGKGREEKRRATKRKLEECLRFFVEKGEKKMLTVMVGLA